MTATFDQANNDILAFFKTAWDTTGLLAVYENVKGAKPTAQAAWARLTVRHGPSAQASLSGATGTSRYERSGILTAQIFIPNGEGLALGYSLAKTVIDAFEGKATPRQVWFRNATVNEVGPSEEWFQMNVTIGFTYDEVK
jgi:hypothetical protein